MSARDLPTDQARAIDLLARLQARFLAPPPRVDTAAWAAEFRFIAKGSERGRWRNERTPYLVEPMVCASAFSPYERIVLMFATQLGKALALDTPIATPSGWSTMGSLAVGDAVFNEHGKPCRVTHVSPVYEDHRCYLVRFSDGAEIVADAGHRWTVDDERDYRKPTSVTLDTEQIAATFKNGSRNRYAIPVAGALELPQALLPVDPYTLGVWLGDGSSASAQFTQHYADAPHIVQRLAAAGHACVQKADRGGTLTLAIDTAGIRDGVCHRGHAIAHVGTYHLKEGDKRVHRCAECRRQYSMKTKGRPMDPVVRPPFYARLAALGLIRNKHIPAAYLRANAAQRLALLQGLMDTDGSADEGGRVQLSSSYPALAAGIVELVRSLGFKPTVRVKKTTGKDATVIDWTAYADQAVFSLPRKAARLPDRVGRRVSETSRRRIVHVEQVATVPVRCIAVDSPSHLFLAGRELIPTHNTEVLYNSVMQRIHTDPQDMMMVQPTLQDAQDHSGQRFLPTVQQTPIMAGLIATSRSRDESSSWRARTIQGGFAMFFGGANSASSLASKPLGFAVADEIDKWPADVDNQGPPLALLEERMSNFSRRKLIVASTPTIKGASAIEAEYLASDRRRYHVPCPHCGERQVLVWGAGKEYGLQWLKTAGGAARPETATYICMHCGTSIDEHHKTGMLAGGIWIPDAPGAGRGKRAGFWLNKLYSPVGWRSWASLVEKWDGAQAAKKTGLSGPLKEFINSSLAETWEEQGTGADSEILRRRAEDYELGRVPMRALLLAMGVDTQPDRLEARVYAFGRGEESWLVDRHVIYGDPNLDEGTPGSPWTRLSEIRRTPLVHAGGAQLLIEATCIDTGGHNTHAVYAYCRHHAHAHVLAVKGASTYGRPVLGKPAMIDINWRGKSVPRGVKVWQVGTDTAKHLLYGRMRLTAAGPGFVHVPKTLADTDEFEQMTAAKLLPVVVQGKHSMRWVTPQGKREEGGDGMVYAYAAACYLGMQTYREGTWARREQKIVPREADLFSQPQLPAQETESPQPVGEIRSEHDGEPPKVTGGKISLSGLRRRS